MSNLNSNVITSVPSISLTADPLSHAVQFGTTFLIFYGQEFEGQSIQSLSFQYVWYNIITYTENTRILTAHLNIWGKISSVCSEIFLTSVDKIADTTAITYVLLSNTYHTDSLHATICIIICYLPRPDAQCATWLSACSILQVKPEPRSVHPWK